MKYRIDIKGVMIPNDYKWYYDCMTGLIICSIRIMQ